MLVYIFYDKIKVAIDYKLPPLFEYNELYFLLNYDLNESENLITKLQSIDKYNSFIDNLNYFVKNNYNDISSNLLNISTLPGKKRDWGVFQFEIDDYTEEELLYFSLKQL